MPETPETSDDIRTIRYKIESIESTQHLLLRDRAPQLVEEILEVFTTTPGLREVYLAVNGDRSQVEIVSHLRNSGVNISQPTVSRRMGTLEEEGLIEKVGANTRGTLWGKKDVVEKVLRLSQHLEREARNRGE